MGHNMQDAQMYLIRGMHFMGHGVQGAQGPLQVCAAQSPRPAIVLNPCMSSTALTGSIMQRVSCSAPPQPGVLQQQAALNEQVWILCPKL